MICQKTSLLNYRCNLLKTVVDSKKKMSQIDAECVRFGLGVGVGWGSCAGSNFTRLSIILYGF